MFDVVGDFFRDEALHGGEKVLNRHLKPELVIVADTCTLIQPGVDSLFRLNAARPRRIAGC